MNPRWKPAELDHLRRRFAENGTDDAVADELNAQFWGGRGVRTAAATRIRRNRIGLHQSRGGRPARGPWTDADRDELRRLCAMPGGTRRSALAEVLKRPLAEVSAEMKAMGLIVRQPAKGGDQRGALLMGAVIEGRIPDEALRSRCRQLAHDLGRDGQLSVWNLKHSHGYTEGSLRSLLDEGHRWFESTPFGVRLTDDGRRELLGGKGAA